MRALGSIVFVLVSLIALALVLAAPTEAEPTAPGAGIRLNMELRDAPLEDVLKHLVEKTGLEFRLEPDVDARTPLTATLTSVTIEHALHVLLEPAGLLYEVVDEVYVIRTAPERERADEPAGPAGPTMPSVLMPPPPTSPAGPAETEEAKPQIVVIQLKHADAAALAAAFGGRSVETRSVAGRIGGGGNSPWSGTGGWSRNGYGGGRGAGGYGGYGGGRGAGGYGGYGGYGGGVSGGVGGFSAQGGYRSNGRTRGYSGTNSPGWYGWSGR